MTTKKPKDSGLWLNMRIDPALRARLAKWQEVKRRPKASDALRIIIEDRLDADKVK